MPNLPFKLPLNELYAHIREYSIHLKSVTFHIPSVDHWIGSPNQILTLKFPFLLFAYF